MRFKIKLVRDKDGKKQERFVEVDAPDTCSAYILASKTENASEMWTPVKWEKLGEQPPHETV